MSSAFTALIVATLAAGPVPDPGAPDTAVVERAVETAPVAANPDFLFGAPRFSLSLMGGVFLPRAEGQFYEFVFDELTLNRDSFRGGALGAELGVRMSDRVHAIVTVTATRSEDDSSLREVWYDPDGGELSLRQTTRLVQGPTITGGLKFYPLSSGEAISRFAWAPARIAPFVSAGVGGSWYVLEQWGDWVVVDENDPDEGWVVTEEYTSDGGSLATFAGAGLDLSLSPRLALTLDGRYLWSEADLRGDFTGGWDPIDLSGLRLSAGLTYRF